MGKLEMLIEDVCKPHWKRPFCRSRSRPTWEIIIINLGEVCENKERIKVTEDMV